MPMFRTIDPVGAVGRRARTIGRTRSRTGAPPMLDYHACCGEPRGWSPCWSPGNRSTWSWPTPTPRGSPRCAGPPPRGPSGTRSGGRCAGRPRAPCWATGSHPPTARTRCSRSPRRTRAGVERLVPVRVGRMAASPYAFLRGAAAIMAEDFARLPATGITPVICGDAHLGNFGFYASPERDLVFDLNDFDEAHPGAWEWDLRRLVDQRLGGRAAERRRREDACGAAVARCVRRLPRAPRAPRRAAAAAALLRAARPGPAARQPTSEADAARDRARRPPGPQAHQ